MTLIFQRSLDTGIVPEESRKAWIVPIYKKGDKHLPGNCRPVSLTSITCKVLEHVICSSIMSHFDQHNILCDNQHGFRKKRSCEALLIVTEGKEDRFSSSCSTSQKHSTKSRILDYSINSTLRRKREHR